MQMRGQAWCGLHDIYYGEAFGCGYCNDELRRDFRAARAEVTGATVRGAFRALAEVGCAVQLGLLAVHVVSGTPAWDGPEPGVLARYGDAEYSLLAGLGGRP